jgi:hypothetical protein
MDRKIIKPRETIIVNRILNLSAVFAISTLCVSHVSAITVSEKAHKTETLITLAPNKVDSMRLLCRFIFQPI